MILALLFALPAVFNGSTWQDAAPCSDLADDLTYSVCAVVVVPQETPASPTGRAAYAAASGSSSTSYTSLGTPDNLSVPEFTHRSGSVFSRARGVDGLNDGLSHTLFGVADGSTLKLYVDGFLVGSGSLQGAAAGERSLCTYGALRRSSGTSSFWVGQVQEVHTWNRAATAQEVQAGCGAILPPVVENCHGHTSIIWDAYVDQAVTHFEVERSVHGLNAWSLAGTTLEKNRPAVPEEGYPALRAETWDVLRAWSLPAEGVRYDYRVMAVRGAEKSLPSNVLACEPQDPTSCFPVACP